MMMVATVPRGLLSAPLSARSLTLALVGVAVVVIAVPP